MPGEIVGLAGITGSGREHVLGLIAGQTPRDDGDITLDGKPVANYRPRKAIASGVAFVPAERALRGTIAPMNVRENLTITDVARFVKAMRLSRRSEVDETNDVGRAPGDQDVVDRGADRVAQRRQPAEGDVRQGAAPRRRGCSCSTSRPRASTSAPRIRSIRWSSAAAAEGVATLVASTDTDELVRLCDRVIVLVDGRAVATLRGGQITAETIEHTQLQTSGRVR